ncbi:MAG: ECF-type sigma factor [Gemmatimonas sp.]
MTDILLQAQQGDALAGDRLMALVYDELHAMAHGKLGFERTGHTLQTTAPVPEAYLKLVDQHRVGWQNRAHFFAVAAMAMRRILVNHAEARRAAKRGGNAAPLPLDDALAISTELSDERILSLNDALDRLQQFNQRGARVVEYRFFGGLGYDDIATTMGLSSVTVRRSWESARAWLRRELEADFVNGAG